MIDHRSLVVIALRALMLQIGALQVDSSLRPVLRRLG